MQCAALLFRRSDVGCWRTPFGRCNGHPDGDGVGLGHWEIGARQLKRIRGSSANHGHRCHALPKTRFMNNVAVRCVVGLLRRRIIRRGSDSFSLAAHFPVCFSAPPRPAPARQRAPRASRGVKWNGPVLEGRKMIIRRRENMSPCWARNHPPRTPQRYCGSAPLRPGGAR